MNVPYCPQITRDNFTLAYPKMLHGIAKITIRVKPRELFISYRRRAAAVTVEGKMWSTIRAEISKTGAHWLQWQYRNPSCLVERGSAREAGNQQVKLGRFANRPSLPAQMAKGSNSMTQ